MSPAALQVRYDRTVWRLPQFHPRVAGEHLAKTGELTSGSESKVDDAEEEDTEDEEISS